MGTPYRWMWSVRRGPFSPSSNLDLFAFRKEQDADISNFPPVPYCRSSIPGKHCWGLFYIQSSLQEHQAKITRIPTPVLSPKEESLWDRGSTLNQKAKKTRDYHSPPPVPAPRVGVPLRSPQIRSYAVQNFCHRGWWEGRSEGLNVAQLCLGRLTLTWKRIQNCMFKDVVKNKQTKRRSW